MAPALYVVQEAAGRSTKRRPPRVVGLLQPATPRTLAKDLRLTPTWYTTWQENVCTRLNTQHSPGRVGGKTRHHQEELPTQQVERRCHFCTRHAATSCSQKKLRDTPNAEAMSQAPRGAFPERHLLRLGESSCAAATLPRGRRPPSSSAELGHRRPEVLELLPEVVALRLEGQVSRPELLHLVHEQPLLCLGGGLLGLAPLLLEP